MGKYADVAIKAIGLYKGGMYESPKDAWTKAVSDIFPDSSSSQEKGCPRDAFLSLCGQGLVVGIPEGDYTRSVKNKAYAIDAVNLIRMNMWLADDEKKLWQRVIKGEEKQHNYQMDVVIGLWNNGLIKVI